MLQIATKPARRRASIQSIGEAYPMCERAFPLHDGWRPSACVFFTQPAVAIELERLPGQLDRTADWIAPGTELACCGHRTTWAAVPGSTDSRTKANDSTRQRVRQRVSSSDHRPRIVAGALWAPGSRCSRNIFRDGPGDGRAKGAWGQNDSGGPVTTAGRRIDATGRSAGPGAEGDGYSRRYGGPKVRQPRAGLRRHEVSQADLHQAGLVGTRASRLHLPG